MLTKNQINNGVQPPTCCICDKELKGREYDSFMAFQGKIYRFCEQHDLLLSLTIHTIYQIREIIENQKGAAKKVVKGNSIMEVAK